MTQPMMTLPQIGAGVIQPPLNIDKNDLSNELKSRGDMYNQMMAAQGMYAEQPRQGSGFLGFVFKVALVATGALVAFKNRTAISEFVSSTYNKIRGFKIQITQPENLEKYAIELKTNFQKNSAVNLSDIKGVQISLVEKADDAKGILKSLMEIVDVTKYFRFTSPNITIFLKDGSSKQQKVISEAIKKRSIDLLPKEAIEAMELVRLNYSGKKGVTDIRLDIICNEIIESSQSSQSYWQRFKDFFNE